jgi:hypothetical protein
VLEVSSENVLCTGSGNGSTRQMCRGYSSSVTIALHTATGRFYPGEQRRLRQAKMKTHHFGPDGLDDTTHCGAKWRDIDVGPLQFGVDPELAVIPR